MYLYAILTAYVFNIFCCSFCIWGDYLSYCGLVCLSFVGCAVGLVVAVCISIAVSTCVVVVGAVVIAVSSWLLFRTFCCTFLMAQSRLLHLAKALLRWLSSSWSSSGFVQTVLTLCVRVLMTLYLESRLWWLSHCKYWSVWVGFWYTWNDKELSAKGVTRVSRNGMAPFTWFPSTVNLIAGSTLLMWSTNSCLWACCWMTHQIGDYGADMWSHRCTLNLLIKLVLKRKVSIV